MGVRRERRGRIPLDRDGIAPVGVGIALSLILWVWGACWLACLLAVVTAFVAWFFRDPPRRVPRIPGAVVSPADGLVDGIRTNKDPDAGPVGGPVISIALNVFNVHVNRAPYPGTIEAIHYQPGRFANALIPAQAAQNESNWIHMDCGRFKMTTRQMVGLVARRIVCRVRAGDRLRRGQRIGIIRFGSRTELFLPPEARLQVQEGERVTGAESILAYLPVSDAGDV